MTERRLPPCLVEMVDPATQRTKLIQGPACRSCSGWIPMVKGGWPAHCSSLNHPPRHNPGELNDQMVLPEQKIAGG